MDIGPFKLLHPYVYSFVGLTNHLELAVLHLVSSCHRNILVCNVVSLATNSFLEGLLWLRAHPKSEEIVVHLTRTIEAVAWGTLACGVAFVAAIAAHPLAVKSENFFIA